MRNLILAGVKCSGEVWSSLTSTKQVRSLRKIMVNLCRLGDRTLAIAVRTLLYLSQRGGALEFQRSNSSTNGKKDGVQKKNKLKLHPFFRWLATRSITYNSEKAFGVLRRYWQSFCPFWKIERALKHDRTPTPVRDYPNPHCRIRFRFRHSTVQCSAVHFSTVQYSIAQSSTKRVKADLPQKKTPPHQNRANPTKPQPNSPVVEPNRNRDKPYPYIRSERELNTPKKMINASQPTSLNL